MKLERNKEIKKKSNPDSVAIVLMIAVGLILAFVGFFLIGWMLHG